MAVLFTNNAATTLSVSANPSDLTLTVKAGDGVLFPLPVNAGDWFPVTLVKQDGRIEICRCTGRSSDTLTVQRSQEGTPALSWSPNERIELRLTAAALNEFIQQSFTNYVKGAGGTLRLTEAGGKISMDDDGAGLGTIATESWVGGQWLTGMRIGYTGTTAPAGWVLLSGRTIGSASSGATERANSDTEALFALWWNSYSNTELPIQDSTGAASTRGASAAADFAANKRLPTPDYRGRVPAGKEDMGGTNAGVISTTLTGTRASTSSGVITGLSSTAGLSVGMGAVGTGIAAGATILSIDSATQVTLSANSLSTGSGSIRFGIVNGQNMGATGGAQTHTLTPGQQPAHAHTGTTDSSTHSHTVTGGNTAGAGSNTCSSAGTGQTITTATDNGAHTHPFTTGSAGGGQAHPNMQPTIIELMIAKL